MSNTKTTAKKSKTGLIIAIFLVVCLIAAAIVIILPKNNTANSVMECSTNPDVQFVLNSKNQVVRVNCVNDDAQILISTTNFEGMTAEEAAKAFTNLCVEANYLPANTTGQTITITIYGNEGADFSKLQESVKNAVNKYFDDNGIIAGAVCEISNSFEKALTNIGADAKELAGKSEKEILEFIETSTKEVEGIAKELRNDFYTQYKALKAQFNIDNLTAIVDSLIEQVDKAQAEVNEQQKKVNAMKDGVEKEVAKGVLSTMQASLKTLKDQLVEAKKDLADAMKKFEAKLDEAIKTLEEKSTEIFNKAKQTMQDKIKEAKKLLDEHKKYFEQNKEEIKAQIKAYRDSIKKA